MRFDTKLESELFQFVLNTIEPQLTINQIKSPKTASLFRFIVWSLNGKKTNYDRMKVMMIIKALFNRIHEVALLLLKLSKLSGKEKRDRGEKVQIH